MLGVILYGSKVLQNCSVLHPGKVCCRLPHRPSWGSFRKITVITPVHWENIWIGHLYLVVYMQHQSLTCNWDIQKVVMSRGLIEAPEWPRPAKDEHTRCQTISSAAAARRSTPTSANEDLLWSSRPHEMAPSLSLNHLQMTNLRRFAVNHDRNIIAALTVVSQMTSRLNNLWNVLHIYLLNPTYYQKIWFDKHEALFFNPLLTSRG